jgi:voltage-gated potassium channel
MDGPDTASQSSPYPRGARVLLGKQLTARRAARIIISVTVLLTLAAGVLMHFTDRKTFPNIGDSMWWSVQTVTTVGYGDLVPTSTAGRILASLVMLVGIGFLTIVTASITSTFIESTRRRLERAGPAEALGAKLEEIGARLEAIESDLGKLAQDR